MHNLTKIKLFRVLLWCTYPLSIIALYPIVLLRKRRRGHLFFFFDRYAIGGAQRVHLDILESVQDLDKTVYFTRHSPNNKLKKEFYSRPNTECHDIHFWCDNLVFRLFSVHYFSFLVRMHSGAIAFGANSTFFYDMLPFLGRKVRKMELLHNFSYGKKGMEFFGLANHIYLDKRLVIDEVTRQNILHQYRQYQISSNFDGKVLCIEFGVNLPEMPIKDNIPPLKILYAGRGTPQKRIWLLNRIVEHFIAEKAPVHFTFAGSMSDELSEAVLNHCTVYDEIGDREQMNRLYREAHAIILTSAFEGFPVVIKEGMAHGCVPIVTALPGNLLHLKHMENALLLENPEDEELVVKGAIAQIGDSILGKVNINKLSGNAYLYAKENFSKSEFTRKYKILLS